jgi:hypothetical protein
MNYATLLSKPRNKISWKYVRYALISCFSPIIWGWNLAPRADVAPIYDAFVTVSTTKIATIMAGFPVAGPLFTTALGKLRRKKNKLRENRVILK